MSRFFGTMLLVGVVLMGGWALYHHEKISTFGDLVALAREQFLNRHQNESSGVPAEMVGFSSTMPDRDASTPTRVARLPQSRVDLPPPNIIRVATFKLKSRQKNPAQRRQLLADICGKFDVVAIQDADKSGIVSRVVHELNSRGGEYRYLDRRDAERTFAMIFNQRTLILDQSHWYSVNDPENLMQHEPLVAWFRARNAPYDQAFSFTLVNVQLNERRPDRELALFNELFRAIRADGRGEDDIVIAGDFGCGDRGLCKIEQTGGLSWAISNQPTNTQNDAQYDNIVFNETATIEFTGNSDVYDFLKYHNLTLIDALNVSERLPVWCDFSTLEGHSPGRVYQPIH